MASERTRHDTVQHGRPVRNPGAHWLLLAVASSVMVAAGCGGSDQARLRADGGTVATTGANTTTGPIRPARSLTSP